TGLASTEAQAGADPDWTVGVRMGKHKDGGYFVLHVVRERAGPQGVRRLIRQTAELDGKTVPVRVEREGGASGKIAADLLVREVLDGWPALAVAPEGSKAERAEPWGSQIEAGNVTLVRGEWNAALLDEHRAFPSGDHDDQVDACSGAHTFLAGKREARLWGGGGEVRAVEGRPRKRERRRRARTTSRTPPAACAASRTRPATRRTSPSRSRGRSWPACGWTQASWRRPTRPPRPRRSDPCSTTRPSGPTTATRAATRRRSCRARCSAGAATSRCRRP